MDIDVDFADASNWDENMPARTEWLRDNAPVFWSEKTELFVISRFEDVVHVSKNNHIFCSGEGVLPGRMMGAKLGLIDEDEPRHGEIRGLINRGFTPRMVKLWSEVFQKIVDEALDEIASKDECDFVHDVAVPLPLLLIAEMIGIRREDRERFHTWSDAMILAQGNLGDPAVVAGAGQAFMEYATYLTDIIEDRRQNPKDDLISILVSARDEGVLVKHDREMDPDHPVNKSIEHREMNNDELIMMCVLLMVAGNETTRNALSGGLQLLIENPDVRQALVDDPSRIPGAVEEMLRLVSPVLSFQRTATQDTELRGVKIAKGQKVLMVYGSANRDPRQFENPETFDLDRKPQHVAFGIGNHFCLGANLARMELRIAFAELLRRFPDMEYSDGGPKFAPSALVRSVKELRVRYTPEKQAAA